MDVVFDVAARCCDCRFHLDTSFFQIPPAAVYAYLFNCSMFSSL